MRIDGAVALVTGASRGIGFALVEALIARGASHVYGTSRNPGAESSADECARLIPIRMDVTDEIGVSGVAALANDVTSSDQQCRSADARRPIRRHSRADLTGDRDELHGTDQRRASFRARHRA